MNLKIALLEATFWRELLEKHQEILEKYKDMSEIKSDLERLQGNINTLSAIVRGCKKRVRLAELEARIEKLGEVPKDASDEELEKYEESFMDIKRDYLNFSSYEPVEKNWFQKIKDIIFSRDV